MTMKLRDDDDDYNDEQTTLTFNDGDSYFNIGIEIFILLGIVVYHRSLNLHQSIREDSLTPFACDIKEISLIASFIACVYPMKSYTAGRLSNQMDKRYT